MYTKIFPIDRVLAFLQLEILRPKGSLTKDSMQRINMQGIKRSSCVNPRGSHKLMENVKAVVLMDVMISLIQWSQIDSQFMEENLNIVAVERQS